MQNFEVRNKNCWASSVGDSLFANILGLFIRFAIISLTTGKTVDNGKDSWQWERLWTMGKTIRQQGKTCWRLERQRTIGETMDIGKDHGHSGKTEWQSERRLAAGKTATLVSWKKHQRKIHRNGLEPLALKKVMRGWILMQKLSPRLNVDFGFFYGTKSARSRRQMLSWLLQNRNQWRRLKVLRQIIHTSAFLRHMSNLTIRCLQFPSRNNTTGLVPNLLQINHHPHTVVWVLISITRLQRRNFYIETEICLQQNLVFKWKRK